MPCCDFSKSENKLYEIVNVHLDTISGYVETRDFRKIFRGGKDIKRVRESLVRHCAASQPSGTSCEMEKRQSELHCSRAMLRLPTLQ